LFLLARSSSGCAQRSAIIAAPRAMRWLRQSRNPATGSECALRWRKCAPKPRNMRGDAALRRELESSRSQAPTLAAAPPEDQSPAPAAAATVNLILPSNHRSNRSKTGCWAGDSSLLTTQSDEQYRPKWRARQIRVRLSGIVLMNLFRNRGTVDNADFPVMRQTQPL